MKVFTKGNLFDYDVKVIVYKFLKIFAGRKTYFCQATLSLNPLILLNLKFNKTVVFLNNLIK